MQSFTPIGFKYVFYEMLIRNPQSAIRNPQSAIIRTNSGA